MSWCYACRKGCWSAKVWGCEDVFGFWQSHALALFWRHVWDKPAAKRRTREGPSEVERQLHTGDLLAAVMRCWGWSCPDINMNWMQRMIRLGEEMFGV